MKKKRKADKKDMYTPMVPTYNIDWIKMHLKDKYKISQSEKDNPEMK